MPISHSRRSTFPTLRTKLRDPRYYQIAVLSGLTLYGFIALEFDLSLAQAAVTLGTALIAQFLCTKLYHLPRFDPRSALISGLSLMLLLRSNDLWLISAAAVIAIASKFVLRWDNRHIFNPTCFGIVLMLMLTDGVWVSAGQWGQTAFFGFLLSCAGMMIVHKATRSDVTLAFLATFAGILFARAWWLGDPFAIPLHTMQNGAIVLFAFFMISDPKTTPNARGGRIVFGSLIAVGALIVQFGLFEQNGLLWSLALFALTVPVLDKIFTGPQFHWNQENSSTKGGSHAPKTTHPQYVPGTAAVHTAGSGILRFLRL